MANVSVIGGLLNLAENTNGSAPYVDPGVLNSTMTFYHGCSAARIKMPVCIGFDASFGFRSPIAIPDPRQKNDIVEAYSNTNAVNPKYIRYQATLHYPSGRALFWHQIASVDNGRSTVGAWHTYAVNWIVSVSLTIYLDGVSIGSITTDVRPATPLSPALGFAGNRWPTPPDAATPASVATRRFVDGCLWWRATCERRCEGGE